MVASTGKLTTGIQVFNNVGCAQYCYVYAYMVLILQWGGGGGIISYLVLYK